VSAYALQSGRSGTDLGQQGVRDRLLHRRLLHRVATTMHMRSAQTGRQIDGAQQLYARLDRPFAVNRILKQGVAEDIRL